jgi:hypothetical protein
MIFLFSISLLTPVIFGFLLLHIILPTLEDIRSSPLFIACLAMGAGIGFTSCSYFLLIYLVSNTRRTLLGTDIATLVLITILYLCKKNKTVDILRYEFRKVKGQESKTTKIITFVYSAAFAVTFGSFVIFSLFGPSGQWDACVIWNLRARFLFKGGELWRNAFSSLLYWPHHTDYPLLIPDTIARIWTYIGKETQIIPILVAMTFTFASVILLTSSLGVLRGKSQGCLAGLILLGTPQYFNLGWSQYADVPLSFYLLSTFILICFSEKFQAVKGFAILAGMMCGLSAWTKNEGLLFFVAIVLVYLVSSFSCNIESSVIWLLWFGTGAVPFLSILIFLKFGIAPANDLISTQGIGTVLKKLLDIHRHFLILGKIPGVFKQAIPISLLLLPYSFFIRSDIVKQERSITVKMLWILAVMVVGYYSAYLISPHDLVWHLDTSINRLALQLWPSILFIYFFTLRTPDEALNRAA